jgi:hypothetical protein
MSDITKCPGIGCPVKNDCYRFNAESGYRQSWFVKAPGEINEGKFTCDMYWGEQAEGIWNQLVEITKTDLP